MLKQLSELLQSCGAEMLRRQPDNVREKPGAGLVSDLDLWLEQQLRSALPLLWPDSSVVGEETGGVARGATWWVDPLDGTTNFVHGWGRSAISVALYEGEVALCGGVFDPYRDECFTAAAGEGAWLNGQRLAVSGCSQLSAALLTTGFAPHPPSQWTLCAELQRASRGVRVSGCASLDLASVAAGRCDAFWEVDLQPWDVAAGLLLVREAGGVALDFRGEPAGLNSGNFLACTPELAETLSGRIVANLG